MSNTLAHLQKVQSNDAIESHILKPPLQYYFTSDYLSRSIKPLSQTSKEQKVDVFPKSIEKAHIKIQLIDGTTIEPANISLFEICVLNAVSSLYKAGNNLMTAEDICRAVYGEKGISINKETADEIRGTVDKLQNVRIQINDKYLAKKKKEENCVFEGFMLPIREEKNIQISGFTKSAYIITEMPILFEYAQQYKYVRSVKTEMLQMKKSNTKENAVLRDYLIMQCKYRKRHPVILYSTVYEHMDILNTCNSPDSYKDATKRIRNKVKAILSDWKEQGHIQDYKEVRIGKPYRHVEVTV